MTFRKWTYLFFTTLAVGGVVGTVAGLFMNWGKLSEGSVWNTFFGGVVLFGLACTFSLISQMGFFAYLSIHRFGLGIFKSPQLWGGVLFVFVVFTLFDLFYLRYEPGENVWSHLAYPLFLLFAGLVTAYAKRRATNRHAFMPTLFLMVVVTTIEWIPVLRTDDPRWMWPVLFTLLASNAWQVLILHRLVKEN